MIPWIVAILFLGSMTVAAVWRSMNPDRYARIGSTVFDDKSEELYPADRV
jgi:hypothetical protein